MDRLRGQLLLQRPIHKLVLFNPGKVAKLLRHHMHLEVVTAAGEIFHLHLGIGGAAGGSPPPRLRVEPLDQLEVGLAGAV